MIDVTRNIRIVIGLFYKNTKKAISTPISQHTPCEFANFLVCPTFFVQTQPTLH
jgi:hypothetical protein